jgi:hypothetical protein
MAKDQPSFNLQQNNFTLGIGSLVFEVNMDPVTFQVSSKIEEFDFSELFEVVYVQSGQDVDDNLETSILKQADCDIQVADNKFGRNLKKHMKCLNDEKATIAGDPRLISGDMVSVTLTPKPCL